MKAAASIVQGVKARLRTQGMSYRELAGKLGVSEPTIKRDMSRGNFSLRRLDRICEVLGVDVSELLLPAGDAPVTELTEKQEQALVKDPRLLVVTYLIVNDWSFADIVRTFRLGENDLVSILLKLDRLRIIDYRPPNRIRKVTARNFSWRKDGAVQAFFLSRVVPEFFDSRFDALGDELRFMGGTLCTGSMLRLQKSLRRVAAEFEELAHADSRLRLDERNGCTAILAFREWEFSEFSNLCRAPKAARRS